MKAELVKKLGYERYAVRFDDGNDFTFLALLGHSTGRYPGRSSEAEAWWFDTKEEAVKRYNEFWHVEQKHIEEKKAHSLVKIHDL